MLSSRAAKVILSLAISGIFLYLTAFKPQFGALFNGEQGFVDALFGHPRFNVGELGSVIAHANWGYIAIAGVFFVTTLFVRAWRWQITIRTLTPIGLMPTFGAMTIGYMANNLLPMRLGEVYRAQVIHQMTGLSRTAAFGTIVAERLIDLIYMVPFIGIALIVFPLPGSMKIAAYVLAACAFVLGGFCVWLGVDSARALRWARFILRVLPHRAADRIHEMLDTFSAGLGVIARREIIWQLAISSLSLWVMYGIMVYLVLTSVGLTGPEYPRLHDDPLGSTIVMLVVTTIGFIIPGAPGAVGTYHGVAVLGLSLFSIPGDRAAGFAVLLHALNYLPLTLLGLSFFWKYGLSFHDATRAENGEKSGKLETAESRVN